MKHLRAIRSLIIIIVFLSVFFSFSKSVVSADEDKVYVTDRAGLMQALASDREEIYVGDIEFQDSDLYIKIDRSVKFIGKPGNSTLKRAHFSIEGSEVESELIEVSFENITFDGAYTMPAGDPNAAASFDAFHGDRTGLGCITAKGYLKFKVSSCVVKNYCAKYGAAMYFQYTDGNVGLGTRASLDIDDCTFLNNISERGIFWCNGKNTKLSMSRVEFRENHSYTSVVVLGGVDGTIEKLVIADNERVVFTEKNSFRQGGGGLAVANSKLLLKGSEILRNQAPYGGGLLCTNTKLTVDSCEISGNSADTYGGGIVIQSNEESPVYILNSTISENTAQEEGAIYVCPADQINIGVPTGVTQFAFCTIENNRSADEEHLIFHPVISENAETTVGRGGTIDFTACVIRDEKVTTTLKDGENYNIINSDRKGERVPADVVEKIANGYFESTKAKMYPGVNHLGFKDPVSAPNAAKMLFWILVLILGATALIVAAIWIVRRMLHHNDTRENSSEVDVPAVQEESGEDAGPYEEEPVDLTEAFLQELLASGKLTEREIDVLREYLSGKTRAQIGNTLFISESTVKNHISNIFAKIGVKNRKQLQERINSTELNRQ